MNSLMSGFRNPKTTVLAFLAAFTEWGGQLQAALDGNVATVPDWNGAITLTLVAIGLLFARDADVSSEKSGAK